ncbi:MAG: hypothetical protein AAF311_02305 [Pseudomonadota bacterium]
MKAKAVLLSLLDGLSSARKGLDRDALAQHVSRHATARFYDPFGSGFGLEEIEKAFWVPLRSAFPDYEIRPGVILEGRYEDRMHASVLGHVIGTFLAPLANIPPTRKLASLRIGINAVFEGDAIVAIFVMLDLIDLMRQSGVYPFRPMPGSDTPWFFAPVTAEPTAYPCDGRTTLEIIREMQHGLPEGPAIVDRATAAAHHSPHWSRNMNWFGPAGIGSSRGMEGFRDSHGALFLKAFPDRHGLPRASGVEIEREGHFCEIGEGRLAMTGGWPVMRGCHTGAHWLGLPPTNRTVDMRVADWYRLDPDNRIVDNWVMIDIPHMLEQMGLNIFEDLPFACDPTLSRLP